MVGLSLLGAYSTVEPFVNSTGVCFYSTVFLAPLTGLRLKGRRVLDVDGAGRLEVQVSGRAHM